MTFCLDFLGLNKNNRQKQKEQQQQPSNLSSNSQVFGKDLQWHLQHTERTAPGSVPLIVEWCTRYIERCIQRQQFIQQHAATPSHTQHQPIARNIYRIPGSKNDIDSLATLFEQASPTLPKDDDDNDYNDNNRGSSHLVESSRVNAIASLLKKYIAQLPDSLIPQQKQHQFISQLATVIQNGNDIEAYCRQAVPQANADTLLHLLKHLRWISQQRNAMSIEALSTVWAPNLFQSASPFDVVQHIRVVDQLLRHLPDQPTRPVTGFFITADDDAEQPATNNNNGDDDDNNNNNNVRLASSVVIEIKADDNANAVATTSSPTAAIGSRANRNSRTMPSRIRTKLAAAAAAAGANDHNSPPINSQHQSLRLHENQQHNRLRNDDQLDILQQWPTSALPQQQHLSLPTATTPASPSRPNNSSGSNNNNNNSSRQQQQNCFVSSQVLLQQRHPTNKQRPQSFHYHNNNNYPVSGYYNSPENNSNMNYSSVPSSRVVYYSPNFHNATNTNNNTSSNNSLSNASNGSNSKTRPTRFLRVVIKQ